MSKTTGKLPPLVQFYERVHDREYSIRRNGLIFSYTDIVRIDRISSELRLDIETSQEPEAVTINGRAYLPAHPQGDKK